jgi:hypothetical protein
MGCPKPCFLTRAEGPMGHGNGRCYSSMVFAGVVTAEHRPAVHIRSAIADLSWCCNSSQAVISAYRAWIAMLLSQTLRREVHLTNACLA